MDRIVSMILNRILRRAVTRGVDAGINAAMGARSEQPVDPGQRQAMLRNAQRARQMTRMARRLTRF